MKKSDFIVIAVIILCLLPFFLFSGKGTFPGRKTKKAPSRYRTEAKNFRGTTRIDVKRRPLCEGQSTFPAITRRIRAELLAERLSTRPLRRDGVSPTRRPHPSVADSLWAGLGGTVFVIAFCCGYPITAFYLCQGFLQIPCKKGKKRGIMTKEKAVRMDGRKRKAGSN